MECLLRNIKGKGLIVVFVINPLNNRDDKYTITNYKTYKSFQQFIAIWLLNIAVNCLKPLTNFNALPIILKSIPNCKNKRRSGSKPNQ